jgi:hypothetical protein
MAIFNGSPLSSVNIIVVEAGTVIEQGGKEEVVTDGAVVFKGSDAYCTTFVEEALKTAFQAVEGIPNE